MTAAISITESSRLEKLEAVIQRGLSNFVEVGEALLEIRDGKLYRESHATFEDYCRDKWNMAQQSATRFMRAAETVTALKSEPIGSLPLTESQARPLTALEPEAQREAWEAAQEAAAAEGKPLAARHVEAAVEQRKPKAKRNGAAPVEHAPAVPLEQALREPTSTVEDAVWQIDFNAEHATPAQLEEAISHLFQRLAPRKKLLAVVRLYHELSAEERDQFGKLLEASK